jgi:hypothetical protein
MWELISLGQVHVFCLYSSSSFHSFYKVLYTYDEQTCWLSWVDPMHMEWRNFNRYPIGLKYCVGVIELSG